LNAGIRASGAWRALLLAMLVGVAPVGCGDDASTSPEPQRVITTYLFREGSGNDPGGPRYSYFECGRGDCTFGGSWDPSTGQEEPAWWDDAWPYMYCPEYGRDCLEYPWELCSDVTSTPKENEEAEELALWLSGSLVAPETLYSRVRADLATIRSSYGDSFPVLMNTPFRPWWIASKLHVSLTYEARERFLLGEYHDLDDLNGQLGLASMEYNSSVGLVLSFRGRLNPAQLAELYRVVPSVAKAKTVERSGDSSKVYPWLRVESK